MNVYVCTSRYEDGHVKKPPPPTAEMVAYKEERKSEVVDYAHGRPRKGENITSILRDLPYWGVK